MPHLSCVFFLVESVAHTFATVLKHSLLGLFHIIVVVQYIRQPRAVPPNFFLQEKLKRLIKYLNFKDIKNKTQKQTSQEDDEVLESTGKYCKLF